MPADLSKSLVHSAEHIRTIIVPKTATASAATTYTFDLTNLGTGIALPPAGSILFGIGPASAADEVYTAAGVKRSYVLSGVVFGASAVTGTATLTATGAISVAKDINFAITFFSPIGL